MAKRKVWVRTLKPVTPENRKKFEALLTAAVEDKVQGKYEKLAVSKIYTSDADMRL